MEPTVKDIMRKKFASLEKDESLADAIGVFVRNPDMAFPVLDANGRVIGEVRQSDLLKLALAKRRVTRSQRVLGPKGIKDVVEVTATKVEDIMKPHNVKVVPSTPVGEAAAIMMDTDVKTLEVIDERSMPMGFVSELDILRHLKKRLEKEGK